MNKLPSFIICLAIVFSACKKSSTPKEKRVSKIQTLSIQTPDPTRIILNGNISKGDYNISEYGFVYGTSPELKKENGIIIKLEADIEEGNFTSEIRNLAAAVAPIVYVRAYFVDENGIKYGEVKSSERPVFEPGVVSPLYGKTEDRISIKGKFFNPELGDLSVTFSDIIARIEAFSDTEIIAVVPKGIPEIHGRKIVVNLSNRGIQTELTSDFEILAHVYDYTPKEGSIGAKLSFEGDNFQIGRFNPIDLPIYFGDVQAPYQFTNTFHVIAPMNVPSVRMPVYVSIKGLKTKLPGEFTLLKPIITEIAPKSGVAGTYFRIKGQNFPYAPNQYPEPMATLGGRPVALDFGYEQITFMSPDDMPTGDHMFTFRAGPFSVNYAEKITIIGNQITGMSPSSGFIGTSIKIIGSFLSGKTYDIYFNGKAYAAIGCSQNGEIVFGIKHDAEIGDVMISVRFGETKTQAGKFTILFPKISSITPLSGRPGSKVIISANDDSFNFTSSAPNVYFGDTKVTGLNSVSLEYRKITVNVPANTKPGKVKIRLNYGFYDVISPEFFEVLP